MKMGHRKLNYWLWHRALSICLEKPVIPVGNQMERAFALEIFRKKRNSFRGIPLFSFLPKWSENQCSICCHPLVPCSLDEYPDFCPKTWRLSCFSAQRAVFSLLIADSFVGHSCGTTAGENCHLINNAPGSISYLLNVFFTRKISV